jgi:molecular chaperone GrpE
MENFRRRQQRVAQDEIQAERQRLLRSFLPIVDNLERALAAARDGGGLREGVELTHRAALQLLQREGVERVADKGQPFDPNWHEAVTTVDHQQAGVEPNQIVEVLAPGYRYGDQLLRPARVVVAV